MTNKILSIMLLACLTLGFASCVNEEDNLFDKSAAERLNDVKTSYTTRLIQAPGGWALQLFPHNDEETGGLGLYGYLLLAKFKADGTVKMGMQNRMVPTYFGKGVKYGEDDNSLWEIITDDGPVLTFNSFNKCIHAFSNPETFDEDNRLTDTGTGLNGDYEFIVVDAPEDGSHVLLKGKKRGTYSYLTPLPAGTDFQTYLNDIDAFTADKFPATAPNELRLQLGGSAYNVANCSKGMTTIYPVGTDSVTTGVHMPFVPSKRGNDYYLRFREDVKNADKSKSVRELRYDNATQRFVSTTDGECYMGGYPIPEFIKRYIDDGNSWKLPYSKVGSSAMCDEMETCFKGIAKKYSSFSMGALWLNKVDGKYAWTIQLTAFLNYAFEATFPSSGNKVSFSYVEPMNAAATGRYNASEDIRNLMQLLSQEFEVTSKEGPFNLRTLRFTATENANIWFEISI